MNRDSLLSVVDSWAGFGPFKPTLRRRISGWLYIAAPWALSFLLIAGMVMAPSIALVLNNWSK